MKTKLVNSGFRNESTRNALKVMKFKTAFIFILIFTISAVFGASAIGNTDPDQPQVKEVTGSVKDVQGLPMQGVSIVVKGTTTGTLSDQNGLFRLPVTSDARTLVFTFIGMKAQEIEIGDRTSFNIVMLEESYLVDEVVVVGYGKTAKKDLTGAVTVVESKDMNKGVYSSPTQMLQGKVPGLNITRSGDPSGSASITLRGPSTLRTGAAMEPFYVIDGVPGASIDAVAPDDIVSINIMRDASSTAIYGSRAANGIIMITTRRARNNESYISYNGYAAKIGRAHV